MAGRVGSKRGGAAKLGMRRLNAETTYADYLTMDSEFGGTTLEMLADGAAHAAGFRFDAAQVWIPLDYGGDSTVIDRVIYDPPIAVFLDGMVHDLRPATALGDRAKRGELRSKGWQVAELNWKDMLNDPIRTISSIWYAT